MKLFAALLASLMFASASLHASEGTLASLESLQWKHRVLLVFARGALADTALANLDEFSAGVEERDMVWFLVANDELRTNYAEELAGGLREHLLERYFTPPPAETMVVLIGKDGGVKSSGPDLDLVATFGLIDQMPMRKAEMRRANDKPD